MVDGDGVVVDGDGVVVEDSGVRVPRAGSVLAAAADDDGALRGTCCMPHALSRQVPRRSNGQHTLCGSRVRGALSEK